MQVAKRRTLGGRCRRNARRLVNVMAWQVVQPSARDKVRQIRVFLPRRLGMRRERIAIGRQLQRAETEDWNRRAFMACEAIVA